MKYAEYPKTTMLPGKRINVPGSNRLKNGSTGTVLICYLS